MLKSEVLLGLSGVIVVMLSVLGSVGFFSAIGVKSTLIIMEVIPFLVLAESYLKDWLCSFLLVVVQLLRTALNCWYNYPPPRWWLAEKPPTCISINFASAHCSASTSHGIAPMAVPSWCTGHCAPVLCIGIRVLVGCLSDAPSGHGIAPMVFLAGLLAQGLGALVLAREGARPHHAPCCCSHGLHATHVVEPMCACSIAMPGCLLGAVKARPWCGQGSPLVLISLETPPPP
ncbi:hypothetical protein CK203_010512 [Vitis vinifera]|uniref:SSD domain-containing protein n=1 Tax=Vitis vinifera TaxID=29760 RepID=A0A438JTV3_VITVI|nr:hypothetical protein CK203_010512 [Vitis vinifera]